MDPALAHTVQQPSPPRSVFSQLAGAVAAHAHMTVGIIVLLVVLVAYLGVRTYWPDALDFGGFVPARGSRTKKPDPGDDESMEDILEALED